MNRSERRRDKRTNRNDGAMLSMYIHMSDQCIISAMDDFGLNGIDIGKILSINGEYIKDYTEFIERKGGFGMINNEEVLIKAKEKAAQYMQGKMQKAKAMKLLKSEFNLPNATLSDLWIDCKLDKASRAERSFMGQSMKGVKSGKVITNEYESYVPSSPITTSEDFNNDDIPVCATLECDKKVYTPEKDTNLSNLKILNRSVEVQGLYGTYTKSDSGIIVNGILYNGKEMVEEEANMSAKIYKDKINDLKKQISSLQMQLVDVENKGAAELEKYKEIKSVFDFNC